MALKRVISKGQAKALAGSFKKYAKTGYYQDKIRDMVKNKVAFAAAKEDSSGEL